MRRAAKLDGGICGQTYCRVTLRSALGYLVAALRAKVGGDDTIEVLFKSSLL
jgi:hypothetical protein